MIECDEILHIYFLNKKIVQSSFISQFPPILIFSSADLKPENILLTFDYKKHEIIDLKLCDFGLGAYFEPKVQLTDFCGSPGEWRIIYLHCNFCLLAFFKSSFLTMYHYRSDHYVVFHFIDAYLFN